jgi:hypothetical protein
MYLIFVVCVCVLVLCNVYMIVKYVLFEIYFIYSKYNIISRFYIFINSFIVYENKNDIIVEIQTHHTNIVFFL